MFLSNIRRHRPPDFRALLDAGFLDDAELDHMVDTLRSPGRRSGD